jgi:NADH-quinone oxidoreductase subunit J
MEWAVFSICAIAAIVGAVGVVLARQTVHAALFLVQTLFCVAVFFVLQEAHFLAAVQVIVYAGAVVILFLFVIMLIGVETEERFDEPLRGQRTLALVGGAALLGGLLLAARIVQPTGGRAARGQALGGDNPGGNIERLADSLFTDFLWPFEITSVLLVIAVVGAVVLVRQERGSSGLDVETRLGAADEQTESGSEPESEGAF